MSTEDDRVGYGRPPKQHRFQPGKSGNSKGRTKGSKNLATVLNDALQEQVVVNVGGRRKSVSKLQAALTQQSNKAAAGDLNATRLLLQMIISAQALERDHGSGQEISREEQAALNRSVFEALKGKVNGKGR